MRNGLVQSFFAPAVRPRIVRAEGIWFIDSEGRRFIDASSGPVACNLGHGNPRVLDAMARQARELAFAFPSQFETDASAALGERLAALCGPGLDRAFLVSGGSEAIETAVEFLRQHAVAIGEKQRGATPWRTRPRSSACIGLTGCVVWCPRPSSTVLAANDPSTTRAPDSDTSPRTLLRPSRRSGTDRRGIELPLSRSVSLQCHGRHAPIRESCRNPRGVAGQRHRRGSRTGSCWPYRFPTPIVECFQRDRPGRPQEAGGTHILQSVTQRRVTRVGAAASDAAEPRQHRRRKRGDVCLGHRASRLDRPCVSSARTAPP